MTRLRRSLRASAPVKFTQEERYEKLISYVMDGKYTETLREFNMPTYVSDAHLSRCLLLTSYFTRFSRSFKMRVQRLGNPLWRLYQQMFFWKSSTNCGATTKSWRLSPAKLSQLSSKPRLSERLPTLPTTELAPRTHPGRIIDYSTGI